MEHIGSSAQDELIVKDQLLPSPLFTGGKKKGINELQTPLLLIRAEFQKSLWKDKI